MFTGFWFELVLLEGAVLSVLFHGLLLYGVCKDRPEYVLPYVVILLLVLVATAVTCITGLLARQLGLYDFQPWPASSVLVFYSKLMYCSSLGLPLV